MSPGALEIPAGNSVSASNLLYLGKALNKKDYLDRTTKTLQSLATLLETRAGAAPRSAIVLAALDLPKPKAPPAVVPAPGEQERKE